MELTIEQRVKKVIADQLGYDATQLAPENSFTNDLGADSLDEVELVMAIEDEFDIEIPDVTADTIKTVQQAVDYVVRVKSV